LAAIAKVIGDSQANKNRAGFLPPFVLNAAHVSAVAGTPDYYCEFAWLNFPAA
jgi:hypothetical protein